MKVVVVVVCWLLWWWFQIVFLCFFWLFSPHLPWGRTHFDEHIFQMGGSTSNLLLSIFRRIFIMTPTRWANKGSGNKWERCWGSPELNGRKSMRNWSYFTPVHGVVSPYLLDIQTFSEFRYGTLYPPKQTTKTSGRGRTGCLRDISCPMLYHVLSCLMVL